MLIHVQSNMNKNTDVYQQDSILNSFYSYIIKTAEILRRRMFFQVSIYSVCIY